MNKLAICLGVFLICEGCTPATTPPPVAPTTPVVTPKAGVVDMPTATATPVSYPKNVIVRQKPLRGAELYPGSLRENIERIAAHYGWHRVIWDAPQDFRWVGHARIQGDSLASILHQLLEDYPLQAVFYQGNHVLYIHSRTLK